MRRFALIAVPYAWLLALFLLASGGCDSADDEPAVVPHPCGLPLPCSLISLQFDGAPTRDDNRAISEVRCRLDRGEPVHVGFDSDILDLDLVEVLGITPTSRVLDVGAGTGVLGFMLLERSIPFERYIAQDIDRASLDWMVKVMDLAQLEWRSRVETHLGDRRGTGLPPNIADVAVLNSVRFAMQRRDVGLGPQPAYDREGLVGSLIAAIEPGGTLHVIEPLDDGEGHTYPEEWVREPFVHPRLELVSAQIITPRDHPNYHHIYRVLPPDEPDPSLGSEAALQGPDAPGAAQ